MPTHTYEARLTWHAGGEGVAAGNHRVEFEGRPAVEVSPAPQYRGDPTRLNPEELFVGALASCQLLTYLGLARGAGVAVLRYEDRAVGTLAIADRKMRITEVLLRPRITLAPGATRERRGDSSARRTMAASSRTRWHVPSESSRRSPSRGEHPAELDHRATEFRAKENGEFA
jgi:organic hydroperoxide reductase OsmC/OhrA